MPGTPPSQRPWILPVVSAVLLGLLLLITATLPYHQFLGGYSQAGAWLHAHVLPAERNLTRVTALELFFVKEPGQIRVLDPDQESADETARLVRERPGDILRIRYRPETRRSGFWAITYRVDHHALDESFGNDFTAAQRGSARQEFIARARQWLAWVSPSVFDRLGRGETIDESRWVPLGILVNIASVILLIAFLFSLRWVRDVPGWVRSWRRARALAAGRCPRCGYPIVDLPRGVCPECGTAFA